MTMSKNIGALAGLLPMTAGFILMKARGTKGVFLKAKSKMIDRKLSKEIDTELKKRQKLQMQSKLKLDKYRNPLLGLAALMSGFLYS